MKEFATICMHACMPNIPHLHHLNILINLSIPANTLCSFPRSGYASWPSLLGKARGFAGFRGPRSGWLSLKCLMPRVTVWLSCLTSELGMAYHLRPAANQLTVPTYQGVAGALQASRAAMISASDFDMVIRRLAKLRIPRDFSLNYYMHACEHVYPMMQLDVCDLKLSVAIRICIIEDFLAVVMMVYWMDPKPSWAYENFDIIELYAGRARISRIAKATGLKAIATDKNYDLHSTCSLELNNNAGLALLGLIIS